MGFLGQNFLKDKNVIKKIINYCSLFNRNIMEIGGGHGVLSKEIILKFPKSFTIIEKDPFLVRELEKIILSPYHVIHEDILNYNIDCDLIISNLPYCITSPFFRKLCKSNWNEAIIMIQKEVYEKILLCNSALSVLINAHMSVQLIQYVNAKSFFPVPKIDSAVLYLKKNNYDGELWNLLRLTFNENNKLLKNIWPQDLLNYMNSENIDIKSMRPKDIHLDLWKKLGQRKI